jgi:PAS domain S-box-containing protein
METTEKGPLMRRRQQTVLPAAHDYTPDIDILLDHLTTLTQRWHGVAPTPPSLSEVIEELTATVDELRAMNEELTQSQQAAIESRQRYQELFEWVPEAYLVTDPQGIILEANRAATYLFHLDRVQLLGLPLAVCVAWEERRTFRTQLARLQNGEEVREWVVRMQPAGLPVVQVACHVAPARDVGGQFFGLRWLLRQLTAQQQEQETIEQQVRELTVKLAHANNAMEAVQDRTELRVRELHYRMKNNLQAVSSLLDWQGHDLEDPRARTVIAACQGRVRAMSLIHELLYGAGDLEHIELGDYLRRLALQVFEAHGLDREQGHLTIEADLIAVKLPAAMTCGLLVHEVLSHGVQHAFPTPHAGALAITLRAEATEQVTLTIRDTGVGLPLGQEIRNGGSFRIHLIRALTEQLRGTIAFTREPGSCVTITFPV